MLVECCAPFGMLFTARAVGYVVFWPLTLVPAWVWGAQHNGGPDKNGVEAAMLVQCCSPFGMTFSTPVENFLFYPNISILTGISHSVHTVGCSNITHLPAGKTLFCFDSHSWCFFPFFQKKPQNKRNQKSKKKKKKSQLIQDKTWGSHGKETKLECSICAFPHSKQSWIIAPQRVKLGSYCQCLSKIDIPCFFLKTKAPPTILNLWENQSWQLSTVAACFSSGACWFLLEGREGRLEK